ncbi:MAG: hypothetical protein NZM09_03865 [Ignavibacterium sp.]|nr:hypothetical protein [Ignavibacterium sp.]MCX7612036.1 hypothetical protein [Ignavibacterium sp.]MDW8374817.1 hypothetical protein [Ignavibacteriales bacterium]
MISILDIDHYHSLELSEFIKSFSSEPLITTSESELLKSDKIIISFSGGIQKAIRKIHLLNLFSALRMISNKPVLGINSGMHLLCEKVEETSCLAMIPTLIQKTEDFQVNNSVGNFSEIILINEDLLFKGLNKSNLFYFESCNFIPKNEFTTSVLKSNQNISTSIRKGNFFGVQFVPQKSKENGMILLKNFIEL